MTATATDPAGNTSEFSANKSVGGGADNEPPALANCDIAPESLPPAGGPVTLSMEVTDNVGAAAVSAAVTRPDGSTVQVPLTPQAGGTPRYAGVFTAPANAGTAPEGYTVGFSASDAAGNPSRPSPAAALPWRDPCPRRCSRTATSRPAPCPPPRTGQPDRHRDTRAGRGRADRSGPRHAAGRQRGGHRLAAWDR